MAVSHDVIVIGAGLQGCSTAVHLARRGARVVVLDRVFPGRHASGVNAGGVRRLGRHPAEIPLSVASLEIWARLPELVGHDGGFRATGQVKIAESDAEMARLEQRAAMVRDMGFGHEEPIGRDELRRVVPTVAQHCVGGLISRADGFASPYHTTHAFHRKAVTLDVEMALDGPGATGIDRVGEHWQVASGPHRFTAPTLVNTAGAWGAGIAKRFFDEDVPLEIEAPMMMVTAPVPHFLDPVVGLAARKLSFKQMPNGTLVIGGGHRGTPDPDRQTTRLDFNKYGISAETVLAVFPHLAQVPVNRCWAGIEGVTPDDIPVISESAVHPGVFHAFGFCGHGFQLGPVVGRILSELILDGGTNLPIHPFRIDRFAIAPGSPVAPASAT